MSFSTENKESKGDAKMKKIGICILAIVIVGIVVAICLAIPTLIIYFVWNNWLQPVFGGPSLTVQVAFGIYLILIVIGGTFKSTMNRTNR